LIATANYLSQKSEVIPNWMIWIQACCFSILYAIWLLPETILVRHVCLIVGALIGAYEIYVYRKLFFNKRAISVWLMVGLFAWVTFHLFFFSQDYPAQFSEYTSIWKRTLIGAIFAVGFGTSLAGLSGRRQDQYLSLMYVGLAAPALIYLIRYSLFKYASLWGIQVPEYWTVCAWLSFCYVPKTAYVCFCVPTFAAALGLMKRNLTKGLILNASNLVYALTFIAVIFIFTAENIKNGILYCIILFATFLILALFDGFKRNWLKNTIIFFVGIGLVALIMGNHLARNDSWKTFFSDAKVAIQIDKNQQWKRIDDSPLPTNDLGQEVSGTNYERMTWAINGVILISQHPFGYGLIERSFGQLGRIKWPGSHLTQSHSGWIDLTLGIGIPGVAMIIGALIFAWVKVARLQGGLETSLGVAISWILFALLLIWITTEISQKVYFDDLIFWITLAAGFSLVSQKGSLLSSISLEK
jgi:hypothetical protein